MSEHYVYPEWIHLAHTFENGQCFRWRKIDENHYVGVVHGQVLEVKSVPEGTQLQPMTEETFQATYKRYFGFGENLRQRQRALAGKDDHLRVAFEYCEGLTILRQDPWETLVTFILSQNNHMPRIRSLVEKLAVLRGKEIHYLGENDELKEETFYTFPSPQELSDVSEEELRTLGFGYRAKYLVDAVEKVLSGSVDLQRIEELTLEEARKELMKIKGVGVKVADCVLLFGYGFQEAFPVDVWVDRALKRFYLQEMKAYSSREAFVQDYFMGDGGLAQQMLFHTLRNGRYT